MLDRLLADRPEREGANQTPFSADDYYLYVDGRSRHDGVESFLASRGIYLPRGDSGDPPSAETACRLGNRKDELFLERLRGQGVRPFPTSIVLLNRLRALDWRTAVISASRNCIDVPEAAGIADPLDARVDGIHAGELSLKGKPDPAMVLEAARRLGVDPARAAVVEDALTGVEAGRRGGFALVIGVYRSGHGRELRECGANVRVRDLGEVRVSATASRG